MRRLPWIVVALVVARPARGLSEDLDAPDPGAKRSKTFEYETEHFSIRFGGGVLIDYAMYGQGDESEQALPLDPESGIRDLRGLVSGKLPWSRFSYTLGYALIASANEWRFRQTGLKIQIPELGGFLFVGRTKEGFSTNKLMVGYYGWFNERAAANDAFIPILADGARWNASVLGGRLVYNVGGFADPLSEKESFNKNDWQVVARAVWLPLATTTEDPITSANKLGPGGADPILHLGLEVRYAGANDGVLQYRSKPESFLAQSQAVDTGAFAASRSTILGVEAYYVHGPFSTGLEYFFNKVSSTPADDPLFHGGEIFAAYVLTGETHPYNKYGYFDDLVPAHSFFADGIGAWELALRCSYVDLESGGIDGGRFLRVTPLVNWYLNQALRFEAAYGYGMLDRMGVESRTHFFQTRIQVQFK